MRHLLMFTVASSLALSPAPAGVTGGSAKLAARAEKALARNKLDQALVAAENAVTASPREASLRVLLGRVYLQSGRFQSAAQSFADALALEPGNGSAALKLALARIGTGDQAGARAVLADAGASIPAGDRGLALALAGDTQAAIPLLESLVRDGGADAQVRQNLALAYALAGRWSEAKLMASYDLDPTTLAARIMDWSRLTRDGQPASQVAGLLGVQPRPDTGQPVMLALDINPVAPVRVVEATPPAPLRLAEAVVASIVAPAPAVPVAAPEPAPIAQPIRPAVTIAFAKPVDKAVSLPRPANGRFAVQIGAFDSLAIAESAWLRATRRNADLRSYTPSTATVGRSGVTYHRLSVSGFATRGDAVALCEAVRRRGDACFIRAVAGDVPLQWAMRGTRTRLAAR